MNIYKQIIFLSLLLIVVMGVCIFVHIDDFDETKEEKVENIVQIAEEKREENNNITQISTKEENTKEETLEKEELTTKEVSIKEEIKESVIIETKEEPVSIPVIEEKIEEKVIITEPEDVQKELNLIVSKQKVYFKRLSTDITEESYIIVEEIANFLKKNENIKIEIGGHTDAKGKEDVNAWVSLQRAKSVKKELTKLGINKDRIKAKGYGESQPLVPNDKNGYSSENRRVEFKIIEE